jgi:hypothetical protein
LIKKNSTKATTKFDAGVGNYLVRLAGAIVFEALLILPEIRKNKSMQIVLNRDAGARGAYERLLEYKKGGKRDKEYNILLWMRNEGMFHYRSVGKLLIKNLKKRVKDGFKTGEILFGEDTPLRYAVADEINEMVFTYDILKHHDGKDFNKALRESANILNNAQHDFAKVATAIILGGITDRFC